jgi:CBS domain-containing protein
MALDVELSEIRDFLADHLPFSALSAATLARLPEQLHVEYFRRGSRVIEVGSDNHSLYVVRTGAVELRDQAGAFMDRGAAGTSFGSYTLVHGNPAQFEAQAIEDTLCLVMDQATFHDLCVGNAEFSDFFDLQRTSRMRGAVATLQSTPSGSAILKTRITDLITRPAVFVWHTATIQEAAQVMREAGVSSLLVRDEDGALAGIVTDRDLRNRVLAVGRDPRQSVTLVMTDDPVTGRVDALAFEALIEMTARNIHHLPILDGECPVGIVTTTDLVRLERTNPVYLVGDAAKATDVAGLAQITGRLPDLVQGLVGQDASAHDIGRIVTAIGDAVERRLIALAEARLGPPPVPYCWVTLGSRARYEQALAADQDNAIILDDRATDHPDPAGLAAYFTELAQLVTDGLVECGYPRCPGDVMATNPRWRVPLAQWRAEFTTWITEPVPDAILRTSIFFDMRPVHGATGLCARLRQHVLRLTPESPRFLAHLAKRATDHEPPLGFFRGFVLEKAGEHKDTLDIKRGGINPVVEIARVYALAFGCSEVDTQTRLAAAAHAGLLSRERAQDLRDAVEFISYVRLRHQSAQVREGRSTDNFVDPTALSSFEKRHLREAFGIVRSAQTSLVHRYSGSYVS